MRLKPASWRWSRGRTLILPLVLLLHGCATTPPFDGRVEVVASSRNQPIEDADCTVTTDSGTWTLKTPGHADVGTPKGDLRVVCDKAGYRTSEVIFRHRSSGPSPAGTRVGVGIGGGLGSYSGVGVSLGLGFPVTGARNDYPSRVIVDMTPLQ